MKVLCISDKISNKNSPSSIVKWSNNTELEITVGEIYTVLAITKFYDVLFYYIMGDESANYPLSFPYYLFKIVNNKTSKYWDTNLDKIDEPESIEIKNGDIISFKEWCLKKDLFYENLLEENQSELNLFLNYREKLLSE